MKVVKSKYMCKWCLGLTAERGDKKLIVIPDPGAIIFLAESSTSSSHHLPITPKDDLTSNDCLYQIDWDHRPTLLRSKGLRESEFIPSALNCAIFVPDATLRVYSERARYTAGQTPLSQAVR
jgi:hypothetical protein